MKTKNNKIICIGAGGSTKVILDILKQFSNNRIIGILDDDESLQKKDFLGFPIIGKIADVVDVFPDKCDEAIICIGSVKDTIIRKNTHQLLISKNVKIGSVISKNSIISNNIIMGVGVIVMPGVIINSGSEIGDNVLINTGVILEHDCVIEKNTFLSPGVILSGKVRVKSDSFVGSGTVISTGVEVGKNVTIGAGSVVIKNIQDNCIAFGNPAHKNLINK